MTRRRTALFRESEFREQCPEISVLTIKELAAVTAVHVIRFWQLHDAADVRDILPL